MLKRLTALACVLLLLTGMLSISAAVESDALYVVRTLEIMVGDQNGNMNLDANVTRAQFAKMLTVAAGLGQASAAYAPFRDVDYTHWASGYIKTATDKGWFFGYVDGTFRPDNTILYEEAATAILRMLGYGESDYSGVYPQAQLTKFSALDLDAQVEAVRGQPLTRTECVTIFYNLVNAVNKQGQVQATTLGYTLNSSGKIDINAMILDEMEGPFVAESATWTEELPFVLDDAIIYLNDRPAITLSPAKWDVFYYSAEGRTLWVYDTKTVGQYTLATPSLGNPQSITVAGNSYTLGTDEIMKEIASLGNHQYGDMVALLFGRNGSVVRILPADEVDSTRYGIVTSVGMESYQVGDWGRIDSLLTLVATDGKEYSYVNTNEFVEIGDLVSAGYVGNSAEIRRLTISSLSGKVNSTGTKIGNTDIAEDAQVLEIADNGRYQTLYLSRLAGYTLSVTDIRFFATNAAGQITHLILNDATGDLHDYGILTGAIETETAQPGADGTVAYSYSGEYSYIINGQTLTHRLTNSVLGIADRSGPALLRLSVAGLTDAVVLGKSTVATVGTSAITGTDNRVVPLSDAVQVYLEKGGVYYLTKLDTVNTGKYTLTAYYDTGFSCGGRVRIVIAK